MGSGLAVAAMEMQTMMIAIKMSMVTAIADVLCFASPQNQGHLRPPPWRELHAHDKHQQQAGHFVDQAVYLTYCIVKALQHELRRRARAI